MIEQTTRRTARGVSIWRRIETRVALVRSTGLVHGVRSWRRDRVLARLVPGRRRQIARALWAEAAAELGAEVVELAPNHFEIRLGAAATRVRGQTVSLNDAETAERAGDKPHVYRLLTDAGLRVPDHETFRASELARVREFLARGPLPCVVKPTRGSGGDGVTGGIRTVRELKRAAGWAARYSSSLLIERQAPGDVFRLLVLGADVLDVVWRRPPTVIGDGRSTIGDLIFAEYDRRICGDRVPGIKPFAADLDCILTLDHQGLSLRSVPADGAAIQVKSVTNYNRPLDNESVTAAISERCRADAVTAAHAAGLRLAGIDIVTPPATTHADGTHVVIDVNPFPALHHHLHVENPGPTSKVAVPILQELLRPPRR